MEKVIEQFIKTSSGNGYGSVYGDGDGSGDGSGYGYGYGSGDGSGSGYGDGDGSGDGSGSGSVYGYGDGSGSGSGSGSGYGSGNGYGSGYGSGSGSGSGSGNGYGSGLKSMNGNKVYIIDGLQTIILSVHGNVAKGFIVHGDLTLNECVIVKQDNVFSHGKDIHEAFSFLQDKLFENYPVEKRIEDFKNSHPDFNKKYSAKDLFDWHNKLTGSCLMGRNSFCRDKNINLEKDEFSVHEFISITKNSYGYKTIKMISN